jgi:pyrroline-5-carboxylate reductase
LRAVGSTIWVDDEAQMDAVTAVSGSGPAYVFYFLEAMEAAGLKLGFDAATARQLAVETFVGAAKARRATAPNRSPPCAAASPPRAAPPKRR